MLNFQEKNGIFILKCYETFTDATLKLIAIFTELYEHVYVVKPLISRGYDTEKFIVCENFNKPKNIKNSLLTIYSKNSSFKS
jgi:23S rRNA U2552 (ribose-2'-O)-methylase RlmE/FtsJ